MVRVPASVVERGSGRLVLQLPASADVRSFTALLQREYPNLELVAQRERERSTVDTGPAAGLLSELTERQGHSLAAAHHAGYFRWPRESTAEEVAAVLDIAAPTLHGHIRKGEQALFASLFDSE